jgi:hypothetical protein
MCDLAKMRFDRRFLKFFLTLFAVVAALFARAEPALEEVWNNPPPNARLRAYWWWLNGNVTEASITRDLEQMKAKGFSGAVLIDANGSDQDGNTPVPRGAVFFSDRWRALFKHALREAKRLDLEISLTIQSGWNLGGPSVPVADACKKYVWSETNASGPAHFNTALPKRPRREKFYRDSYVVAYPIRASAPHQPLENYEQKALLKPIGGNSTPSPAPLFQEYPATANEQDTDAADVTNLTDKLGADGKLNWDVPPGKWEILRFGYTIADHAHTSTSSEGGGGYALDVLDDGAFNRYWDQIVEPLIADAGPLAGTTLKYLYTDSWETELVNWTPSLRHEFQARRGYDMTPWLPALAGRIVNTRDQTDRFLADYRQTVGDLAIDHHYRLYRDGAHRHGLQIHPESGGPHPVPIDAQRCLGWDDVPMSEFWAWATTHRVGDDNRFFVKQAASAAHTYGRKMVFAEAFTDLGPHWQESIGSNLKPTFDKALCEGFNVVVWHAFVCSPEETGIPGQQYFAGTHLNPKVTWWPESQAFFGYINRCQALLEQGLPCGDVLYYYGDGAPNFAQLKKSDPAQILPGYDYDVINEEALLERVSVRDGRLVLPEGTSYRVLVLADRNNIALPVLRKLRDLANAGATIIGPKPIESSSLTDYPRCDEEVKTIAAELWSGRVRSGTTARDVLQEKGVQPDFAFTSAERDADIDYIHRTEPDAEIYFVANRASNAVTLDCSFRVEGKAPELWDAVSGQHEFARAYSQKDGRTHVPLDLNPCGSIFVIFRQPAADHPAMAQDNAIHLEPVGELSGPWKVSFDPKWGGPKSIVFTNLDHWIERPEPGIRYYSGTVVYRKTFNAPAPSNTKLFLDLGDLRELAAIKVNGKSCGIVWCPPYRVDITAAVHPGENQLEVDVVNMWANRLIGDASLPADKRFTRTNIRKLTAQTPLLDSGLFGPVRFFSSP